MTLASFGGTFITGGQKGRKAVRLAADEDSVYEREFVNAGDRCRGYCAPDEVSDENIFQSSGSEETPSLARRLLTTKLRRFQILAVANAVLEDPRILVTLYREATELDETINPVNRRFAQEKMFDLMRDIMPIMCEKMTKRDLARLLQKHRDDETDHSVFRCLLDFARREATGKSDCSCSIARETLAQLGFHNIFACYVD